MFSQPYDPVNTNNAGQLYGSPTQYDSFGNEISSQAGSTMGQNVPQLFTPPAPLNMTDQFSMNPTPTPAAQPAAQPVQGANPAHPTSTPSTTGVITAGNALPWYNNNQTQSNMPFDISFMNPQGVDPNGNPYSLNPMYYASDATSQAIAQMLGGSVTQGYPVGSANGGPWQFPQGNMIQLPNGVVANAADIANLYTHGYSDSYIQAGLAAILSGGTGSWPASDPNTPFVNSLGNGQFSVNYDSGPRPPGVAPQIPPQPGGIPGYANWQGMVNGQPSWTDPTTGQAFNPQFTMTNPTGNPYAPANLLNYGQVAGFQPLPTQAPAANPLLTAGVTNPAGPGYAPTTGDATTTGANSPQNLAYLQSIYNSGGNPINQTPAWQAMIDAQQRNITEGQAQLAEQFNLGGNRFSTSFGNAATDYQLQTQKDQNALLAQMTAQAGENAQQRMLTAGSQLSGQDFQSQMQQYQIAAQMAQLLASQQGTAANQLAQYGAGAAGTMYGGAVTGTQGLYGAENNAAQAMFGAQNSTLPAFMNQDLQSQQLGLNTAGNLSNLWNQNLLTGQQLGTTQYSLGQQQINNAYQEWLRTQPQNNPLLSMMYSAATYYPSPVIPGYQPGAIGGIMQGLGTAAGGLSDRRVKEDIHPYAIMDTKVGPVPFYTFRYIWAPEEVHLGVMADDLLEIAPHLVSIHPSGFMEVNYAGL